jgi:hypothetical protein
LEPVPELPEPDPEVLPVESVAPPLFDFDFLEDFPDLPVPVEVEVLVESVELP